MNREEEFKTIKDKIKEIIKSSNSTLNLEEDEIDRISFATRANGNVGEEKHSVIDLRDAVAMRNKVTDLYEEKVKAYVEIVDEWVYLNVIIV